MIETQQSIAAKHMARNQRRKAEIGRCLEILDQGGRFKWVSTFGEYIFIKYPERKLRRLNDHVESVRRAMGA